MILHIDGDAFFVSCEVALRPELKGKPVITGSERGIASAMSYEAKRAGVTRGMPLFQIKKICPDVVIIPSDYETYSLFSKRMYEIVRRYSNVVEEYSIDECFAIVPDEESIEIGWKIKKALQKELNMTFSFGIAPTKVLAKIGSKWQKPDGLTIVSMGNKQEYLANTQLEKIWGIGLATAKYLNNLGLNTALDLSQMSREWVQAKLSKPFQEIWYELNGTPIYVVTNKVKETYQSISKTRTFTPPSNDPKFLLSQLSKNIENACIKTRRYGLVASGVSFFIKNKNFDYFALDIKFNNPTSSPSEISKEIIKLFPQIFRKNMLFRATGVTLTGLQVGNIEQVDLFGSFARSRETNVIFKTIDEISEKYGKHTVFLGSSLLAINASQHLGNRGDKARRKTALFRGEGVRQRLRIPMLGDVS